MDMRDHCLIRHTARPRSGELVWRLFVRTQDGRSESCLFCQILGNRVVVADVDRLGSVSSIVRAVCMRVCVWDQSVDSRQLQNVNTHTRTDRNGQTHIHRQTESGDAATKKEKRKPRGAFISLALNSTASHTWVCCDHTRPTRRAERAYASSCAPTTAAPLRDGSHAISCARRSPTSWGFIRLRRSSLTSGSRAIAAHHHPRRVARAFSTSSTPRRRRHPSSQTFSPRMELIARRRRPSQPPVKRSKMRATDHLR